MQILKRLMLVGGAGCQMLLSLLLMALEMCHTFCAADIGGPMMKEVAFITVFCGEF